jgi:heat shock protein HspQ
MGTEIKFFVGQIVHHKKFDYRGVIFDVDATFQGTEEWYDQVARSRPPKDRPWYHVLVHGARHTTYVAERHGARHTTYVAERHLEADSSAEPIEHSLVGELFGAMEDGRYLPRRGVN